MCLRSFEITLNFFLQQITAVRLSQNKLDIYISKRDAKKDTKRRFLVYFVAQIFIVACYYLLCRMRSIFRMVFHACCNARAASPLWHWFSPSTITTEADSENGGNGPSSKTQSRPSRKRRERSWWCQNWDKLISKQESSKFVVTIFSRFRFTWWGCANQFWIIFEAVVYRQVQVVVAAGGGFDERIQKSDPKPKSRLIRLERDPRPDFGSTIFRRLRRLKMWSSRNQMLNDNDGDDVAFLSGSGDDILWRNVE